jgi:hypothetical protein
MEDEKWKTIVAAEVMVRCLIKRNLQEQQRVRGKNSSFRAFSGHCPCELRLSPHGRCCHQRKRNQEYSGVSQRALIPYWIREEEDSSFHYFSSVIREYNI